MTLVPLCLILPMIGLSAGGVLLHREHAAAKERGLANNLPANNHHRPTIPYGGSSHGGLGNYVGGITPRPYDRQGEEKLRVIKITRTYAIPYPVPVPLAKNPHHGPTAPWPSTNLRQGKGGVSSGYHGPAGNGYHGSTGSGYHGSTGSSNHGSTESGYHGSTGSSYHGANGIADHIHDFPLGGSDLSHNSLEYTGPSEFFSGYGSNSGNHGYSGGDHGYSGGNHGFSGGDHGYSGGDHGFSGGDHGYSGGNHGFSGGDHDYSGDKHGYTGGNQGFTGGKHHSLQDDVYQRHGYSTSKPFRPSQEYTPPELNDHSYSHDHEW